jgi:hypothetical protein
MEAQSAKDERPDGSIQNQKPVGLRTAHRHGLIRTVHECIQEHILESIHEDQRNKIKRQKLEQMNLEKRE